MARTMTTFAICILGVLVASLPGSAKGNILVVTDGNYSAGPFGNDYWINSGPFFLHYNGQKLDTDNGTLRQEPVSYGSSGLDKLGNWQNTKWIFYTPDNVTMEATLRTYPNDQPNIVVFSQTFPQGLNRSRAENANFTATGFPTFRIEEGVTNTSVGFLQFAGYMLGDRSKRYGRWTPATADVQGGIDGSGPLVLFDEQGGVIIISAMDNSMAASMWLHEGVLAWGIMGGVDNIPPGFTLQTLMYLGDQGVGQAFREWGRTLRQWHDKTDDVTRYHQSQDITLTHLGYWTDNGAFYYYHTENGKNYEQTLPDVMKYASQQKLPYRHIQLDSWWYPKDKLGAVTTWDANATIFPHGLRNLSATLQLPIAAHNRYWSVNTTYAKENGGHFDFFIGRQFSLPTSQAFWDWLFKKSAEWGLVLYEQDWLNVQTLKTELLQTNITAGADWLDSMARAARYNNMTIQYCMAQSRHALHSLRWPEVTQARVTDDYQLYKFNWKIGVTSHLAAALGLAPSKDTFWTTSVQPGNIFNKTEPYPDLQSAIATLSTGPVGPGDGINLTNRDVLMRCCADDGLILKPSRPATAIDAMFMEMAFGEGSGTSGEVWSTYTDFGDFLRFGIILAANVTRAFNITPTKAGFSPMVPQFPESRLFVRNSPDTVYKFSDTEPFDIGPDTCNSTDAPLFCLYYTSPVFNVSGDEVILLGELDKWVPMSPQRVVNIQQSPTTLTLTLGGQPGEKVNFSYLLNGQLKVVMAYPGNPSGCVSIDVPDSPVPTASTSPEPTTEERNTTKAETTTDVDTTTETTETPTVPETTTETAETTANNKTTTEKPTSTTTAKSQGSAKPRSRSLTPKKSDASSSSSSSSSSSNKSGIKRSVYPSSFFAGTSEWNLRSGQSCRFAPPPFTPPPPTNTPSPPPVTSPEMTSETSPVTSPERTTKPGPGGGASGLGVSYLSIILVVMVGYVWKL